MTRAAAKTTDRFAVERAQLNEGMRLLLVASATMLLKIASDPDVKLMCPEQRYAVATITRSVEAILDVTLGRA